MAVTCDNASNNDTMVDQLHILVDEFPGAENRVRCFDHVINLTARQLTRQFDAPKKKKGADDTESGDDDDDIELDTDIRNLKRSLEEVENDIENEELVTAKDSDDDAVNDDMEQDDNTMTAEERNMLQRSVLPMRLVLGKVSDQTCSHNCSFYLPPV